MATPNKTVPEEIRPFAMNIHIMNSTATTNDDVAKMKLEMEGLLRAVCAALNSPKREVLILRNMDQEKLGLTKRHLDKWKQRIEGELSTKLKTSQWRKCFDFCDLPQDVEYLYCHTTPTPQPTTINFNLRLPTDTSTELVDGYHRVMSILSREAESLSAGRPYFDFDEHLRRADGPHASSSTTSVVTRRGFSHFPGLLDLKLGDTVQTPESKTVQYKKLKDGERLVSNIEKQVSDYFGAFANHDGGWIVIGIENKNYEVVGQTIPKETKVEIERCLDKCARRKIWGRRQEVPVREKHWDVYFHPLGGGKHLVEVRVNPFYGGVFQKAPESYTFEVNDNGEKVPVDMAIDDWMEAMMRQKITEKRRSDEMSHKFEMLSTHICGGCTVFALKNARREIQERMFTIKEGVHIWPETYHSLVHPEVAPFLDSVISALRVKFRSTKGVCVISRCIAVDIGIPRPEDGTNITCDILVFTETETPFLVTLGTAMSSDEGERYSREAAIELEERLTRHGGEGRFFIKSYWYDQLTDPELVPGILESILGHRPQDKPASYHQMHLQKLQAIVAGLVIAIAAFTPETYLYMKDLMGVQVMNLLTPSQLLALSKCKENQYVCIQGYPGTGKTVVGVERAKQLRLDGAQAEEILYIPSNVQMAKYVRDLTFPRSTSLHGSKICLSEAFRDIIQMLKDGSMPENVKYLILDDTQNLLSRRNVPASNVKEDIRHLTPEMRRLAVRETPPIGLLRQENYQVDWLKCLCIWLREKRDNRMVIICDESQSLEKEHYYQTLRQFIKESNGTTVTLNVIIRNSEEITEFFKNFVSTQCYGVLPTTAHDFKGQKPLIRPTLLSPESLRETVKKFTTLSYSPNEISLLRHDRDSDRTALDTCMSTPLQKECMAVYRTINNQLIDLGIEGNGVPGPQVFHAVLFFCLLTKELLERGVRGEQETNFKINLALPCFASKDTACPPFFLRRLLSDRGRYTAPVRDMVVRLFEEKWQYLCELYRAFVQSGRPHFTEAVDILEERKSSLLQPKTKEMTNLQKLYSVSEFLLGPVTVPEHIFRLIDVQHAGFCRLIVFHILPNVHAIHGTHEVPTRGQCIRIESLENFAGRENQVVIGIMPHKDTLERYTFKSYVAALSSRARTKLEILSATAWTFISNMDLEHVRMLKPYFDDQHHEEPNSDTDGRGV
ncbi:schlafen family member 11-like [Acanthaster planci]|uniref:Schlafen family member 11-like n=1 Tax=Acanthaster planci TaxID=133434 RepID=A0A8B7YU62_ACAPL|nr:schlafen family member 11-like [Acanthaster planci]XP_022096838.1 schlafen family member 11-like [Acanthaster planci]XP_022096839.1 schlafen family member 11-like [Acanthaster planci]